MILYDDQEDLIECIPNISEGRDQNKIAAICKLATDLTNTQLLAVEVNPDANRSVLTMVGPSQSILESARRIIAYCQDHIDMRDQLGVHPRIGAVDVCPFVNLGTADDQHLKEEIHKWTEKVTQELGISAYLYEQNARRPDRKLLADVRRGNYEKLEHRIQNEHHTPDFGPGHFDASFGAMVTGLRDLLVAFNVSLPSISLTRARQIARTIREGGESGFIGLRAIGWYMEEYSSAQVSMNITNLGSVRLREVLLRILDLAYGQDTDVREFETELIGLMPHFYLQQAIDDFQVSDFGALSTQINLRYKSIGLPTIEYQYAHPQKWTDLLAMNK